MSLLFIGPGLLLFAILMMGLYPGERLLMRIAGARDSPRPPRRAPAFSKPLCHRAFRPRGGALLALALAGRAPPL